MISQLCSWVLEKWPMMAMYPSSPTRASLSTKRRTPSSHARSKQFSQASATNIDNIEYCSCKNAEIGNHGDQQNRPKNTYNRPTASMTSHSPMKQSNGCMHFASIQPNQLGSRQSSPAITLDGHSSQKGMSTNISSKWQKPQRTTWIKHGRMYKQPTQSHILGTTNTVPTWRTKHIATKRQESTQHVQ